MFSDIIQMSRKPRCQVAGGTSQAFAQWWGRRGHLYWTHRGIPLRLAENILLIGEARIFRLFTTSSEVCCGAGRPSRAADVA